MEKKYGRTYHLPISPGATGDDKTISSLEGLMVDDLVVTEKMDGENTTIHAGGMYARSPDSRHHPSRNWMKAFAAGISPQLGNEERIVGENLYAQHSLAYRDLPSYFMGFAWIVGNKFQAWDSTIERFDELGITAVKTIYRGPFRPGLFEELALSLDTRNREGFVVRVAGAFAETEMQIRMAKYVRADHVQTETHWMKSEMTPNLLSGNRQKKT
ncbi:RNA ligase family protein [Rhizobium sp. 42MFCr.1]|uniref:RNA ligase family protein n=1 Tax=Rhizobium sp. 42MFCr.1 TaxID=1048680 RepID=UPI0003A20FDD|nr:RNA ligase family protein [Rhizobium sp. 42MFCr.1]